MVLGLRKVWVYWTSSLGVHWCHLNKASAISSESTLQRTQRWKVMKWEQVMWANSAEVRESGNQTPIMGQAGPSLLSIFLGPAGPYLSCQKEFTYLEWYSQPYDILITGFKGIWIDTNPDGQDCLQGFLKGNPRFRQNITSRPTGTPPCHHKLPEGLSTTDPPWAWTWVYSYTSSSQMQSVGSFTPKSSRRLGILTIAAKSLALCFAINIYCFKSLLWPRWAFWVLVM